MKQNTNKTTPLISIIIPVFNGANFIGETVNSILKSSYKNFEIILVDDGSTDKTKKTCQKLEKKNKKIKFYSFNKNKGLSHALNFAISKTKGKYIARLNQDDLILPYRLKKQLEFLEKNKDHVAVGGQIELFNKNGIFDNVNFPLTNEEIKKQWLYLSPFSDPAVMYRKKAFAKTKGYKQSFWPVDDVHMWYQLGKIGKLANLKIVLTKVRWHNNAGSIKFHKLQMKKLFKLHVWASKFIEKPSLYIWGFWLCQYMAGYIFPPYFNWAVYRLIRKMKTYTVFLPFLTSIFKKKMEQVIVTIQPKILSRSGV